MSSFMPSNDSEISISEFPEDFVVKKDINIWNKVLE